MLSSICCSIAVPIIPGYIVIPYDPRGRALPRGSAIFRKIAVPRVSGNQIRILLTDHSNVDHSKASFHLQEEHSISAVYHDKNKLIYCRNLCSKYALILSFAC